MLHQPGYVSCTFHDTFVKMNVINLQTSLCPTKAACVSGSFYNWEVKASPSILLYVCPDLCTSAMITFALHSSLLLTLEVVSKCVILWLKGESFALNAVIFAPKIGQWLPTPIMWHDGTFFVVCSWRQVQVLYSKITFHKLKIFVILQPHPLCEVAVHFVYIVCPLCACVIRLG